MDTEEIVEIPVVEETVPEPVPEVIVETPEPAPQIVVETPEPAPAPAPVPVPKKATGIAGVLGTIRSAGVKLSIQY